MSTGTDGTTDELNRLLTTLVGFAAADNFQGIANTCAELRRLYHFTVEDFKRAYNAGMSDAQAHAEARLNALMREGTAFRCVNCGTLYDVNK